MTGRGLLTGLAAVLLVASVVALAITRTAPSGSRLGRDLGQPAQSLDVVALGTSLTANAIWPDAVGEVLAVCLGHPVSVTRIAMPGARSDWGVARLDALIAAEPELLLIEFTANDSDIVDGLWPWQSLANHTEILSAVDQMEAPPSVWLIETGPALGMRGLARPLRAFHRRMIYDLAAEHRVGLIDLEPATRAFIAQHGRDLTLPDGLHPTEAAQLGAVVPEIVRAIAGASGKSCQE